MLADLTLDRAVNETNFSACDVVPVGRKTDTELVVDFVKAHFRRDGSLVDKILPGLSIGAGHRNADNLHTKTLLGAVDLAKSNKYDDSKFETTIYN